MIEVCSTAAIRVSRWRSIATCRVATNSDFLDATEDCAAQPASDAAARASAKRRTNFRSLAAETQLVGGMLYNRHSKNAHHIRARSTQTFGHLLAVKARPPNASILLDSTMRHAEQDDEIGGLGSFCEEL